MIKALIQGVLSVALFLLMWTGLSRIDWVSFFSISEVSDKTEEKLGELFWDLFKSSEMEFKQPFVVNSVDTLVSKICKANHIDRNSIKVHLLEKDDVNAFALPDGHLVIFTGLISEAANQEEFCGVIGHELAHIQEKHVMQKLVNEVGISVLIAMINSGRGSETITQAAKVLSSTAFDRKLEKEADIKAVDYLSTANINPQPFADFLFKLSEKNSEAEQYWTWLSTHPDSKERSEYIVEYCKMKKGPYATPLNDSTWTKVKGEIDE
ncbi:MAG: M48 family metallopeptidase [Bacteroidota bacterium]